MGRQSQSLNPSLKWLPLLVKIYSSLENRPLFFLQGRLQWRSTGEISRITLTQASMALNFGKFSARKNRQLQPLLQRHAA